MRSVRRRRHIAMALCLGLGWQVSFAAAQTAQPEFAADLMRFSQILGTVAFLDDLCSPNSAGGGQWRQRMASLLDAQGLKDDARRPYVDAFNRGQGSMALLHRRCGADEQALLDHYLEEGASLSDRLNLRYGTGGADGLMQDLRPTN